MKILLAIDGFPPSLAAVDEVCRRPWPAGSQVRLVTVRSPVESMLLKEASHLPMLHDQIFEHPVWRDVKFMDDAAAAIERLAPELQVTPVLLEGRAKDAILDEAEQWDADLIMVGSHGSGIIKHIFLGSVSLAVAVNAKCSVEIVRNKDNFV